ncbi:MAG: hypothetical protein AAFP19_16645 [Bacteroidota bacterium]
MNSRSFPVNDSIAVDRKELAVEGKDCGVDQKGFFNTVLKAYF